MLDGVLIDHIEPKCLLYLLPDLAPVAVLCEVFDHLYVVFLPLLLPAYLLEEPNLPLQGRLVKWQL